MAAVIIWATAMLVGCASSGEYTETWEPQPEARRAASAIVWAEPPQGAPPESSIIWSDPPESRDTPSIIWYEPARRVHKKSSVNYQMARNAERMIGVPYRWGGSTPEGFDCSGLIYYAYRKAGVTPPRTTWDQYQSSRPINRPALQTGDLLFFRLDGRRVSHVGIYLGQDRFVHAPATGKHVSYANLNSRFWRQRFIRAGRL